MIFLIFILAAILSYRFRFFWAYLVSLDVDVTRNITAKICEVWGEFNILCTLVTIATAAILNFVHPPTPKSCHTLRWIFLQSFMKFEERNPKFVLIPPFLFPWQVRQSLSNRFQLDVEVVPINFHQFLFGE